MHGDGGGSGGYSWGEEEEELIAVIKRWGRKKAEEEEVENSGETVKGHLRGGEGTKRGIHITKAK